MREYRILQHGDDNYAAQYRPAGWRWWPWRWMRVWVANGLPGGDYEVSTFTTLSEALAVTDADRRSSGLGWRVVRKD